MRLDVARRELDSIKHYLYMYADESNPDYDYALDLGIAAIQEKQERENPKPLTLDQLRLMEGEPVWWVDEWLLISKIRDNWVSLIEPSGHELDISFAQFEIKNDYSFHAHNPKEDSQCE